jgi:hypothetical protein
MRHCWLTRMLRGPLLSPRSFARRLPGDIDAIQLTERVRNGVQPIEALLGVRHVRAVSRVAVAAPVDDEAVAGLA